MFFSFGTRESSIKEEDAIEDDKNNNDEYYSNPKKRRFEILSKYEQIEYEKKCFAKQQEYYFWEEPKKTISFNKFKHNIAKEKRNVTDKTNVRYGLGKREWGTYLSKTYDHNTIEHFNYGIEIIDKWNPFFTFNIEYRYGSACTISNVDFYPKSKYPNTYGTPKYYNDIQAYPVDNSITLTDFSNSVEKFGVVQYLLASMIRDLYILTDDNGIIFDDTPLFAHFMATSFNPTHPVLSKLFPEYIKKIYAQVTTFSKKIMYEKIPYFKAPEYVNYWKIYKLTTSTKYNVWKYASFISSTILNDETTCFELIKNMPSKLSQMHDGGKFYTRINCDPDAVSYKYLVNVLDDAKYNDENSCIKFGNLKLISDKVFVYIYHENIDGSAILLRLTRMQPLYNEEYYNNNDATPLKNNDIIIDYLEYANKKPNSPKGDEFITKLSDLFKKIGFKLWVNIVDLEQPAPAFWSKMETTGKVFLSIAAKKTVKDAKKIMILDSMGEYFIDSFHGASSAEIRHNFKKLFISKLGRDLENAKEINGKLIGQHISASVSLQSDNDKCGVIIIHSFDPHKMLKSYNK